MKVYLVLFTPNEGYEEPKVSFVDIEHKDTPPALVLAIKEALKKGNNYSAEIDFDVMNDFNSYIRPPCEVRVERVLMLFY